MKTRVRQTVLVAAFCMSILVGLLSGLLYVLPLGFGVLFVAAALVLLPRKTMATLLCVVFAGLSIGVWRGSEVNSRYETYNELYKNEVVFEAKAVSDGTYFDNGQTEFDVEQIHLEEPFGTNLPGRVRVRGHGVASVVRGDTVHVEGKMYPATSSRVGSISFAKIEVLGRSGSVIEKLRRRFYAGMYNALPEPAAPFALGLLLGQRSELPDDTNDALRIAGLTHIVAVSGYNLTILVRFASRLRAKKSRYQSLVLSLVLIGLFLLFTGFSASIVRASIVSVLSLTAWYFGRRINAIVVLLVSAAATALWNPAYVWRDIGWYLSFLAFFGVLILAPLLLNKISKRKKPSIIVQLVVEAFSAQILVLPYSLYLFGVLPTYGLLANILVVPLVPFAMLLSLFAGITGMFMPWVAALIGWPAKQLLTYMLEISDIVSRFPKASYEVKISLWMLVISYVFICVLGLGLLRYRQQNRRITDIDAV